MDFVKKKAFEAQLKKAGLGSIAKPFTGSSGSNAPSPWSAFSGGSPDERKDDNPEETETFPVAAASAFDEKPKNFPPFLHLFYIDRSILSDEASPPVKWALCIFSFFLTLLCFNTAVAILFTTLNEGKEWLHLVLSAVLTILLSIYQLFTYETAFRGAYRTSSNLRRRYLFLSTANIVIISLYTFLGVLFFNGWARIPNIGIEADEKHVTLRKFLTVVEALGWTALLFLNTYILFDYYHLYKGRDQGLSPSALEAATNQVETEDREARLQQPGGYDANRERVQEIRDRYGIP